MQSQSLSVIFTSYRSFRLLLFNSLFLIIATELIQFIFLCCVAAIRVIIFRYQNLISYFYQFFINVFLLPNKMINTLPNCPQMWMDNGIPIDGHSSHLFPPLISTHHQFHQFQDEVARSTGTDTNGKSFLIDDHSPHNVNSENSPTSVRVHGSVFLYKTPPSFYTQAFSQQLIDEQRSWRLAQQHHSPLLRCPLMMIDRVKNPCKVFIGGIGHSTVESTIRQHFSQYGLVSSKHPLMVILSFFNFLIPIKNF